jgi:hypothetical protein
MCPQISRAGSLLIRSILFAAKVRERSPLPKKEPMTPHVDCVSGLRLWYSHLHSQTRARAACFEGEVLVRLRSLEGEPCDVALGLGLLNSQKAQGYLDAAE